ncbi:MAG: PQQ-dependent sugar dehydrogenase [Gammaproteobacteria bacterium]|nr:PQQ-dependent sugar dehydrogenase [Gammaproteobacteria bacterium]MDH3411755.1 PQQ-dependent sugar dehydrogenase [Gammaproteobacteria bacterium]
MIHRTATAFRYVTSVALAVAVLITTGCGSGGGGSISGSRPQSTNMPVLTLERAFPALSFASPVAMLQAPGDNTRWFVVERGSSSANGKVIVFPNNNAATPAQTSELISIPVAASGEGGLLGMAFHPNFPTTPQVFLSYTRTGPDPQHPLTTVISRFTHNGGTSLDPASEQQILTLDQPFTNHNGGQLAFGPDGFLYIGMGDGGSGDDPQNHGQNVNTLLGAMLRIDVNGVPAAGKNYAIPGDNPFASGGGAPEIYSWGLRNPWRWSFDRGTGRLWLGDVGQGAWEEVDIIERGGNYGWKLCEGAHLRGSSAVCGNAAFIDPIAEYDHSQGCSITGGYVYRGANIPDLSGVYLFGDFCSGTIWTLREISGGAPLVVPAVSSGLSVVSFGESLAGEVYVVNLGGTLHKVITPP